MPTCPAGHTSASGDFCDVCGVKIGDPAPPAGQSAAQPLEPQPQLSAEPCPHCGTARSGRFCESCGFDFDASVSTGTAAAGSVPGGNLGGATEGGSGAQPGTGAAASGVLGSGPSATGPGTSGPSPLAGVPLVWTAVVASDQAYFENVVAAGGPDAATLTFPAYCPERRFRLAGPEMRVGRRSVSQGLEPEIDLTGPPTDPGVSRLHAVLIAEPDGSWAVLDPGSENGTIVNGSEIAAGVRVPLRDGDRIHVGAWTVITIHAS
jgi:FHA domain